MQRRDIQRLQDIKQAIGKIGSYWGSGDAHQQRSGITWDAILYNFLIIGEAVKALSDEVRALAPQADWSGATKMRDFVIHHYTATDLMVVATAIENDLPKLEREVDSLLARGSG